MDEQKIIAVITNIFNGADKRDWALVLDLFSNEVFIDYFSMNQQPGSKKKPTEIIENWTSFLTKFKFTLHFISNFSVVIEGNIATAFCKGQAMHHIPCSEGGDLWLVFGTYDFKLTKTNEIWKVNSMIFNLHYQQGNEQLTSAVSEENS